MEEKINLKNLIIREEEKSKKINNSLSQIENENLENNNTSNQYVNIKDKNQNLNTNIHEQKLREDRFSSSKFDTHILLEKNKNNGEKAIGNIIPYEFKKSVDNKENINSNSHLNFKLLFNEKTNVRNQEEERKNYENNKINSNNIENFNKNEIIENNNILYKDIHSYFNNGIKNNNQKENNEIKKENKIYKNNYNDFNINNSINHKIEIENEPQKKKLTILEYLQKIKKMHKQKNYKEENKSIENCIKPKEKISKSERTSQKDCFFKTESKNNKAIKEYQNKIKNNIYFDLNKYLQKKKDNRNINLDNNLSKSSRKNLGRNKYNSNTYYKEVDKNKNIDELKNNCNELYSMDSELNSITDNLLINKQRKSIRNRYVESRIVSDKNLNFLNEFNEIENLNNYFQNINLFTNTKKKKGKKTNYLNEKNKTINLKYSLNNIYGNSLDKRKQYSQTVKLRTKKGKKIKDKNKSILTAKDKINTTMENKKNIKSFKNINFKLINSNSNKSNNLDSNKSFGVNYIVQKRKMQNDLFNTKKIHKNQFINTSNNFNKTYDDINNDIPSLIKIKRNKNNRKNNTSYKKLNDKESDYIKKRKIIGQKINLELKIKNININKKNSINKFKKGKTIILSNITSNSKSKIGNNEIKRIKNIKSIENYQGKKRKIISNKIKNKFSKLEKSFINKKNLSNKLITNYRFSNTQKVFKFNKRGRDIKINKFNLNDSTLIKAYEDNNYNKLNNSHYNTNEMNY